MFGGLAGWLIVVTANALDLIPPSVPWTAPAGLVLVAALVGGLAYSTHQRIQVRHERIEPQRAVAFLVLGKASALAGAVVAGGYLAYGLMFITRLDAAGPRDRVIRSALAVRGRNRPDDRRSAAGAGLQGARRARRQLRRRRR